MWTRLPIQACNISLESMGELIDTEDTQPSTDMPPSQVPSSGGNNNKKANELTVASSNPKSHLTYYGKSTVEQNQAIKEKIFCHLKLSSLNCRNQLFTITTSTRQGQSVTLVSLANKK